MVAGAPFILEILGIMLVFFRVGTFWISFPVFAEKSIPPIVRLMSAIVLSISVYPLVKDALPVTSTTKTLPESGVLLLWILREVSLGLIMGLVARSIFFAAVSAAQWLSIQIGFSVSAALDPATGDETGGWIDMQRWLAIMLFFAVGGHLSLLHSLKQSYMFSFEDFWLQLSGARSAAFWIEWSKEVLAWTVQLSGPIVVVLLSIQFAFGILSKFVPQINVWSVSVPVTIAVGIFAFTVLSPMYSDALKGLIHKNSEIVMITVKYLGSAHGR